MKTLLEQISGKTAEAFEACGLDPALGRVTVSNRPDLCEYQCNGALAAAKTAHRAPILIASEVAEKLKSCAIFSSVEAVKPGFINLKLSGSFLASQLDTFSAAEKHGVENPHPEKVIIDYGGPNVAKPLHVGHLRSAVIGESVKRILRYCGDEVIGDVHLGDWGLQMGLIIAELQDRQPDLVYFDPDYKGEYPAEAPFTIGELEEIYPDASARSKKDADFADRAHEATAKLQDGVPGYRALWNHILNVSVADLKKNYEKLDVHFDLWKKESDAQPYIPELLKILKDKNLSYLSNGALVVDVAEAGDAKEVPPCIILKSDGASLYQTTDLATIIEREKLFHPDRILYVVDKRQQMHFTQVFRVARRAELVPPATKLDFLGFGTMNGKDGKPFKTREGGVMRLETLIGDIDQAVYDKMADRDLPEEKRRELSEIIGLAALKYGDLSNQASKDYVFDTDRFTSFEGNTGPYIQYTIVRIKSILKKAAGSGKKAADRFAGPDTDAAKQLMINLAGFSEVMQQAADEFAPHKICAYIYGIADQFNRFYHETNIMAEPDADRQAGYLRLISYTREILETCIGVLGFAAPDEM